MCEKCEKPKAEYDYYKLMEDADPNNEIDLDANTREDAALEGLEKLGWSLIKWG